MKQYYNYKSDISREHRQPLNPPLRDTQRSMEYRLNDDIIIKKKNKRSFGKTDSQLQQDELNSMKKKMSFVFEKDKEIQSLQQKLEKSKIALDKMETVLNEKKRITKRNKFIIKTKYKIN